MSDLTTTDPHARISPDQARLLGCTCTFGCRNCGMPEAMMGACASWNPCPLGREENPSCPLVGSNK